MVEEIYRRIGNAYAATGGPELTSYQREYIAVAMFLVATGRSESINVLSMIDLAEQFQSAGQEVLAGMCGELADRGCLA